MQQFAGHFLAPPLPLIGLLMVGLLLGRAQRVGRVLTALGALGLLVCSIPLTGKLLAYPLLRFERAAPSAPAVPAAILVPTAGAFNDAAEGWWRSEARRVGKECVSPCRSRWATDH